MRDIAQSSAVASSLTEAQVELGWNIILLCEVAFLLDAREVHRFRRTLVRRFAKRFNAAAKCTISSSSPTPLHNHWRALGDAYYVLHLPCHYGSALYAKQEGATLHLPLPPGIDFGPSFKDVLLTLLEFAADQDCSRLRLYWPKNSAGLADIKRIVANLHWIGGRIARNEDRDALMDTASTDDLLAGDEELLILEFDC